MTERLNMGWAEEMLSPADRLEHIRWREDYRQAVDRVNRMTDNGDVLLQQTEDGHHKFVDAPEEADDSPEAVNNAAIQALEAQRERLNVIIQGCHQQIANSMSYVDNIRKSIELNEAALAQITVALSALYRMQEQK